MNDEIIYETFNNNPVDIISGPGALGEVFSCVGALDARRLLVVCGENVVKLPAVNELRHNCPDGIRVQIFDQVEPDPSDSTIVAGGEAARDFAADTIVAVGGGSSMDAGKAIAAEAGAEGWILTQDRPGQPTTVPAGILPIIAVPTTAGTGSEVTPFSVITFTQTQRKLPLNHPGLYPRYALLDPNLLISAPRIARVAAGMDALTHAVESYVSKEATEHTQRQAREAISLITQNLRQAAEAPSDIQAQAALQRGAMIAGLAFAQSRLGIVHAMALPLSALFGVPHGQANAILLPYGMEYNRPAAVAGFANIAEAMGVSEEQSDDEANSRRAVEAVEHLAEDVQASRRMRDVGVTQDAIPRMAEEAMKSPHIARNPRAILLDDLIAVYERAY